MPRIWVWERLATGWGRSFGAFSENWLSSTRLICRCEPSQSEQVPTGEACARSLRHEGSLGDVHLGGDPLLQVVGQVLLEEADGGGVAPEGDRGEGVHCADVQLHDGAYKTDRFTTEIQLAVYFLTFRLEKELTLEKNMGTELYTASNLSRLYTLTLIVGIKVLFLRQKVLFCISAG